MLQNAASLYWGVSWGFLLTRCNAIKQTEQVPVVEHPRSHMGMVEVASVFTAQVLELSNEDTICLELVSMASLIGMRYLGKPRQLITNHFPQIIQLVYLTNIVALFYFNNTVESLAICTVFAFQHLDKRDRLPASVQNFYRKSFNNDWLHLMNAMIVTTGLLKLRVVILTPLQLVISTFKSKVIHPS